ncbi:MAG: CheB methylesterase domain-containing protein [Candidatus Omnitrophica bacterium]|nr:CheB methylesterase domain-containing protein [Candidatus Omnitrophota bacterium]
MALPKKEAEKVIVIGLSTGGPQALQVLLSKFPANIDAGILIVQHMSKGFIDGLVEWLRFSSHLDIRVAKPGEILKNSAVLFAPDDYNIEIDEEGRILLSEDTTKRLLHVPSIDVMMKSAAASYDKHTIGVIMTGMGSDGVDGINAIKSAGGVTIAQDQESSVIYGMNKIAVEKGYVDKIIPLDKIPQEVLALLKVM